MTPASLLAAATGEGRRAGGQHMSVALYPIEGCGALPDRGVLPVADVSRIRGEPLHLGQHPAAARPVRTRLAIIWRPRPRMYRGMTRALSADDPQPWTPALGLLAGIDAVVEEDMPAASGRSWTLMARSLTAASWRCCRHGRRTGRGQGAHPGRSWPG